MKTTNPSNEVDLGGLDKPDLQDRSDLSKPLPEAPSKRGAV